MDPIFPLRPSPSIILKSVTSLILTFNSFALFIIAKDNGCSECFSREESILKKSISFLISNISLTSGLPFVSVPVLSNTTVVTLYSFSKLSAFFMSIPLLAPLPTPTIIAVGVASPSAQGHAITNTPTKQSSAFTGLPTINYTTKLRRAIIRTTGTNIFEISSANL